MELPKKYDPKEAEAKWHKYWRENKIYKFDEKSKKPVFSIDTPPPYASANHLHVGHAMHYSHFEFISRYKKMKGHNVFFPMGFDDNGLPTERYVEKKHKVNKNNITRAEFIKLCIEETEKTGKTYEELFNKLGFSLDWDLLYHTIGPRATAVSQKSFIDLFKKQGVHNEETPISWCTKCQTAIAQAEFENVELESSFNDIKFISGNEELIISTTRPELIPACVGLFAHPDDDRYKKLRGKFAKVPLFNYEVPILFDEAVAMDKGTGLMMVCTFGDKEDVEKWHKHNLELRTIISKNGKLNELAGEFEGMRTKEARKAVLETLDKEGLLVSQKNIVHPVNVHDKCLTEVEYLKTKQWFIKVLSKKHELLELGNKINWHPQHMKVRYDHWVENLNWDWCISRQRYYGVPFPVWFSKKTGEVILADEEQLPVDPQVDFPKTLPKGHTKEDIIPENDVMDTWMTSSVSPQINQHWGMKDEKKGFMPMSLRPQAHDIIRTWAFYTIAKSYYHNNSIPWTDIMISGHGQDAKGRKMSKSKGNFVVANEVMEKYSADALRFWAASTKLGEDVPYMEKEVLTGQKTITKLWNASKFGIMQLEDYKKSEITEIIDEWIVSKFNEVVKTATEAFENFEYSKAKQVVENFFWNTFCDYYLEIVKDRLYNPDKRSVESRKSAQEALYRVILGYLKLFAPIMPHITEEIYHLYFNLKEKKESIHVSDWPEYKKELSNKKAEETGDLIVEILAQVRKLKSEKQMSLGAELESLDITLTKEQKSLLKKALEDLQAATRAKEIKIVEGKELIVKF